MKRQPNNKKLEITKKDISIIKFIISGFLFFFSIELFVRIPAVLISNYADILFSYASILFMVFYASLIMFIIYILPKKASKITSILFYTSFELLFIINYMLIKIKKTPLSISLLKYTKEAVSYKNTIVSEITPYFILGLIISILFAYLNYKSLNELKKEEVKKKTNQKYSILCKSYGFILIMIIGLYFAGKEALYFKLSDTNHNNPIDYYENHNIYANSLVALGLYEYTARDIYFTFHKSDIDNMKKREEEIILKYYKQKEENEYTGKWKDKNLIMIMLESMDNRILSEENTPSILKLRREGWDFTKRYSYVPFGGSTIYTEFASITGIYKNHEFYEQNLKSFYNDALPAVMGKNGYKTTYMHENVGSFYERNILQKNYFFDNTYFLMDMSDNVIPYTDAQMVDNDEYYSKLIDKDNKFMTFITTISAHGPYTQKNKECIGTNSEYECFAMLAKRTDVFIEHLIKRLKEDSLLDDTVIVLFTDHHAYTYPFEKDYLDSLETIDKNHNIKSIPFIIYSTDIEHKEIDDILVNDIDIVPTILNLFGIDYDPNTYIGTDLFSSQHKNISIFEDHSWYDGKVYSPYTNYLKYPDYKKNEEYVSDILYRNKIILSTSYWK